MGNGQRWEGTDRKQIERSEQRRRNRGRVDRVRVERGEREEKGTMGCGQRRKWTGGRERRVREQKVVDREVDRG